MKKYTVIKKKKKKKREFEQDAIRSLYLFKIYYILPLILWCESHFTNISACEVCGTRAGSSLKRELHTHIHLDYSRVNVFFFFDKDILLMSIYIYI